MAPNWIATMKRVRENYYCSLLLAQLAKPIQRVCGKLASQLKRSVRKNGVGARLPSGQIMRIARDSGIGLASLLFWDGIDGYERETSKTLRFFFSRVQTFVDVGANYGMYTILGALWNLELVVVAFEPSAAIYSGLKRNVALNGLEGRITCENLALADRSGRAILHLPRSEGKDVESTGTLAANSWQVRQAAPGIQIGAVTFDDYESSHPMKVDLIKIDVEDFEASVLAGMRRVIERDRPFIICEILPRLKEHKNQRTLEVIDSLAYFPYWITSCGYVRVSSFDFQRAYTDFILSPVQVPAEVVTDLNTFWTLSNPHLDQD
jgi:FkbM family methyltransferase